MQELLSPRLECLRNYSRLQQHPICVLMSYTQYSLPSLVYRLPPRPLIIFLSPTYLICLTKNSTLLHSLPHPLPFPHLSLSDMIIIGYLAQVEDNSSFRIRVSVQSDILPLNYPLCLYPRLLPLHVAAPTPPESLDACRVEANFTSNSYLNTWSL